MRRDDMKEDWSSGAKRKLRDIEIMSSCANYIHITNSFSPILSSCFLSYLITFSLIFSSPLSSSLLCSLFMIPSASSQFHFLSFILSSLVFSFLLSSSPLHLVFTDYRWWWRSLLTSGSTALYVFLYSIGMYLQIQTNIQ